MLINEVFGWSWILLGFLSGMVIGLKFHHEEWLGGYGSHQRRLIRLGHISFLGLGILNILFAYSLVRVNLAPSLVSVASIAFIVGGITMPIACGLLAWQKRFHFVFFIPVSSLILAAVLTVWGLLRI